LTGQVETLAHDLDQSRKDAADAKAAVDALADRVDKLEKAAATQAPPPPPPPPGTAPSAEEGPAMSDPKTAYDHARELMLNGDYAGAAAAFQGFIDRYADTPNAPAARYWLGEIKFVQQDYAGAAQSYVAALHGWPSMPWAPDATVRLASSLVELNRPHEACAALGELERRYPKAPEATKTRAAAVREKAKCSL
jgi:tol-pal system protein YbgF